MRRLGMPGLRCVLPVVPSRMLRHSNRHDLRNGTAVTVASNQILRIQLVTIVIVLSGSFRIR